MKIRILESSGWYKNYVSYGFEVNELDTYSNDGLRFRIRDKGWVYAKDCVITELPESFCVKRCDDTEKWNKYIKWLNRIYDKHLTGDVSRYYGVNIKGEYDNNHSFATELHIDDIIKHIDFYSEPMVVESDEEFDMSTYRGRLAYAKKYYPIGTKVKSLYHPKNPILEIADDNFKYISNIATNIHVNSKYDERLAVVYFDGRWAEIIKEVEFDMTTNEGRLDYAKKHYPIGTKYIPLAKDGNLFTRDVYVSQYDARYWGGEYNMIKVGDGLIYHKGKWVEIIKEETKMETQKLSRQGLKEIHSIACSNWKAVLERYGANSPLEDYIELTQEQVNNMFKACTKEQLPIVSKYLKQDDGSVDLSNIKYDESGGRVDGIYILRHDDFDASDNNSFWLNNNYDWILKVVKGDQRLYPTKKK